MIEQEYIKPMTESKLNSNKEFFDELKNEPSILEKLYGNISSFNFFRRNVGYEHDWEESVMKARGLFLNNQTYEIVGRSYNKFFAINEKPETMMNNLKQILKFPTTAYLKENGYLGILGYDSQSDSLIFASKASIGGEHAIDFERIFYSTVTDIDALKLFCKNENVSMIFEVEDTVNFPHIIEYDNEHIVLLDIVYREPNYRKFKYDMLVEVANKFGLIYKQKSYTLTNWQEFEQWYETIIKEDYLYNGNQIEGFVIEDSNGYMIKIKLYYYLLWKRMRKVKDNMYKDNFRFEKDSFNEVQIQFYEWMKQKSREYLKKNSIIQLRKEFENEEIIR